ncbi:MAG: DUF4297 domain-containing protein [Bdellovibrionales bacterium]|nr:DUF4297 domain-containing protein [Bdellovibrionales bacterium]
MANQLKDKQLKFLFRSYTPQVRAGSRSNNRFSFQEAWSLDRLLDQHGSMQDYLAVFDFHEDFVIFEDTVAFKAASFFQIKTKDSGQWRISDLTNKGRSKKCFLDKLAETRHAFRKMQMRLFLVINGTAEIAVKPGANSFEFGLHQIESADQKKIRAKIAIGKTPDKCSKFFQQTSIVLSTLPLDESQRETQLKGKLTNLITKLFPQRPYQIIPIYECLKVEISRRSKFELEVKDIAALRDKKGISKDQFAQFLSVGVERTEQSDWVNIQQRLTAEGVSLKTVKELRDGYNELLVLRTSGSPALEKIACDINEQIAIEEVRQSKLIDLIETVHNNIKSNDFLDGYKETVIRALVAHEYQKKG